MPEVFYQFHTLCLCLSCDLPEADDVRDLRLVTRQTFNDGLIKDRNTPAGLNMRNKCAENMVTAEFWL